MIDWLFDSLGTGDEEPTESAEFARRSLLKSFSLSVVQSTDEADVQWTSTEPQSLLWESWKCIGGSQVSLDEAIFLRLGVLTTPVTYLFDFPDNFRAI